MWTRSRTSLSLSKLVCPKLYEKEQVLDDFKICVCYSNTKDRQVFILLSKLSFEIICIYLSGIIYEMNNLKSSLKKKLKYSKFKKKRFKG